MTVLELNIQKVCLILKRLKGKHKMSACNILYVLHYCT